MKLFTEIGKKRALEILFMIYRIISEKVDRPVIPKINFNHRNLDDITCRKNFRFDKEGIILLTRLLKVPEKIKTSARDTCSGEEAVCILLNRMAYPKRLHDMMYMFGRSESSICRIFLHMVDLLFDKNYERLYFHKKLMRERLTNYRRAIYDKGAPVKEVFAFIDGTKIPICRPGEGLQIVCFSGHKRVHCLSFQGVTAPDGLCIHFWGPVGGNRHDGGLLRESGLKDYLKEHEDLFKENLLYGDPAYGVNDFIFCGFKGNTSAIEKEFNKKMSGVRQSVEWSFGRMKILWAFIDFKKNHKLLLSPVGKVMNVAMLLTNCHTCYFGGNQISMYFNLNPPTLEEYLSELE
jgi:hypothetical protein